MSYVNSIGQTSTHSFTGVRLRDVLTACGADPQALGNGATLTVTAGDDFSVEYPRGLIQASDTLLAWKQDGQTISPRMCPGSSSDANMFIKEVAAIKLNP